MGDIKFDLEDRLVEFSCRIIEIVEAFHLREREFILPVN